MFKLLTEEQKKRMAQEYALRRWVIVLWAAAAVIIIGMVGLFPSYLLSRVRHEEMKDRLSMAGGSALTEEERELKTWVEGVNRKLKFLNAKQDGIRPSAFINDALTERIVGVKIKSIEWKLEGGREALVLSGESKDRQTLVSFESALKESGKFGEVVLPISNLAKDKDIGFEVKLFRK